MRDKALRKLAERARAAWTGWRDRVRALKRETAVLYLALRDRRTPWYAKALLLLVVAYAASPIDLIPDFIPVLGLVDDLILIPAGIVLALRLVPANVVQEYREQSTGVRFERRYAVLGASVVAVVWLLLAFLIYRFVVRAD